MEYNEVDNTKEIQMGIIWAGYNHCIDKGYVSS